MESDEMMEKVEGISEKEAAGADMTSGMVPDGEFIYEDAVARIQEIVGRIEKGEIPFSELVKEVKTANGLISRCREYLREYEKEMMANME